MSGNILISGFRFQREEVDSVYEVVGDLALSVSGEVLSLLKKGRHSIIIQSSIINLEGS